MWYLLLIATVVAVFLLYHHFSRPNVDVEIARSAGTFDAPARRALHELRRLPKTPRRSYQRARILRYNLARGSLEQRPVPREVVDEIAEAYNDMLLQIDLRDDQALNMIHDADTFDHPAVLPTDGLHKLAADAAANRPTTVYADDAQNVHDSYVNNDLRKIMGLLDRPADVARELAECRAFVAGSPDPARALETLDRMRGGNPISSLDTTEDVVLATVWLRSKHPRNAANRDNIQAAILAALKDANEDGTMVCISGRCARAIGALVAIDFDPATGSFMNYSAWKDRIYTECRRVIEDTLRDLRAGDPGAVAEYEGPTGNPRVEDALKDAIKKHIEGYAGQLFQRDIDRFVVECQAAV